MYQHACLSTYKQHKSNFIHYSATFPERHERPEKSLQSRGLIGWLLLIMSTFSAVCVVFVVYTTTRGTRGLGKLGVKKDSKSKERETVLRKQSTTTKKLNVAVVTNPCPQIPLVQSNKKTVFWLFRVKNSFYSAIQESLLSFLLRHIT